MLTLTNGVGMADLQRTALAEARRYMREAKGDRVVATGLVLERLVELTWITAGERDVILKMFGVGRQPGPVAGIHGVPVAAEDHARVQRLYDGLITDGSTSDVALVLAGGIAGSFQVVTETDGTTSVFLAAKKNYQAVLGGAGAIIGGALGGGVGAALGGAIGGAIGYVVDDCKD